MLKNKYYWFKSIISTDTCQKIIDLGLSKIEDNIKKNISVEATTFGNKHKDKNPNALPLNEKTLQQLKKEGEDNKKFYIRDSQVAWLYDDWLYDLIMPIVRKANLLAGWNFQFFGAENFQFTVYNSPGGFYGWHTDGDMDIHAAYKRFIYGVTDNKYISTDGNLLFPYKQDDFLIGKVRKISLTINLNNPGEYEGGNLMFDFGTHSETEQFIECTEIRPQGSLIAFPSFIPHCVTPVTKGKRYSLVLWVLGDPFK